MWRRCFTERARFGHRPALVFLLRGVDEKELIAGAGASIPLARGKIFG